MSNQELVHAYRHLLRWSLRAVQFSKPARFVVRDTLRAAFRDENGTFEPSRVKSTLWFLESAATYVGVEHKIIKNLVHVRYIQEKAIGPWRIRAQSLSKSQQRALKDPVYEKEYEHFDKTIAMLNDTMNLCLR
ncbi:hypothetical protein N0V85_002114 [Neurospora sp. IMI 360204]|uniref:DUF1763-domain-containing protein n=1 Tax=Neurospora tetraspora TaxID=94610 RepID=A0AAE0JFP7_9PEZI|nr:hypothetical protein N0V85_002114 [Neurospora sp. IMI 360204]KAK3345153.1 hypothetical protein B0H65DRAFT_548886 [Neurospora tetraspora]